MIYVRSGLCESQTAHDWRKMAISRANVENVAVKRVGPLMTKAGMDGTTVDGSNTDLADGIGWALRQTGYSVADITNPTTAEVAAASDDVDQLLDMTEFRTLENIIGNLDDVNVTVGPRKEDLSDLSKQVQKRIDQVEARVKKLYGVGVPSLSTGTLTFEFAEHQDGTQDDE